MVQNNASSAPGGKLGIGPNTIEFVSNSTITIEKEGQVLSKGSSKTAEAVNVLGFGNKIINHGILQSTGNSTVIWFEDNEAQHGPPTIKNKVENYGVIARGTESTSNQVAFGSSSSSANTGIIFINHTGSKVIGSLGFGMGDDYLEFYDNSTVTGDIDGGGGKNHLTLNGVDGSVDSLRGDIDITNFATLDKNGEGLWDIVGSLDGFTVAKVNNGILKLSGDNSNYSGQLIINPEGNNDPTATVEAAAKSLPIRNGNNTSNIINNGVLNIDQNEDDNYIGQIIGTGQVIKTGDGILTLTPETNDGNTWSGGTTIRQGFIAVSQDNQLGADTGAINFDGGGIRLNTDINLSANRAITIMDNGGTFDTNNHNSSLSQAIQGNGTLTKTGDGILSLTGNSTDKWSAKVSQGGMNVDGAMAGNVSVLTGAQLTGSGSVGNTILESGSKLSIGSVINVSDNDTDSFTINGNLTNNGTIQMSLENDNNQTNNGTVQKFLRKKLQINGDYRGGKNSLLLMNSILRGDNSPADHVTITGNTSGSTAVTVTNLGGHGARTFNGIELIRVQGNSSSSAFFQKGRILAGAYDYSLVQKGKNWYLINNYDELKTSTTYRPEIGGYIANLMAANTMFNLTLDDREGGTEYFDPISREYKKTAMWMRQQGGRMNFRAANQEVTTHADRYVVQLGGEVAHGSYNEEDRWNIGLMGGYANQHANTKAKLTGYDADSNVDGYSIGIYATWFENAVLKTGWYVDGWAQYGWFNNKIRGKDIVPETWKSRGATASLETGYTEKLAQYDKRTALYVQPQVQAIWMGVKSQGTLTESNGTHVQDTGNNNVQTRLGVRLYLKGHSNSDDGKQREFKPYIEANWIHNTEKYGVKKNNETLSMDGARNVGELKIGVQGQITPSLNLWGGVVGQLGSNDYSDVSAMLGIKYLF
ncbi:autotransporter outer membrane beta-barrel domain-containing protein [Arsenophonus nasoniae]|uniref:Autotransporter outer membrane beta-barrel domain-containing protein n=1 Tax=Arsenophonus nasoniae TaxID=638 RepID=A0AA95K7Y9_9GAMM|nr:autotransporter outer membrane beta-barrel domain-containing protein [Arsenophonus nasoniae]WGL95853.1 autotransporter outer membrane beta-barrel domain-containing protein [Arsenophonus nasoniae]